MSDDQFNTLMTQLTHVRMNQVAIMEALASLVPGGSLTLNTVIDLETMWIDSQPTRRSPTRGRTREEQRNTTHEEPS